EREWPGGQSGGSDYVVVVDVACDQLMSRREPAGPSDVVAKPEQGARHHANDPGACGGDCQSEPGPKRRATVGLGATRIDIGQGGKPWIVMADPKGKEFCVMPEVDGS